MPKPTKTPKAPKPKAEKPAKAAKLPAADPAAPSGVTEAPAPAPAAPQPAAQAEIDPARGPARVDGWEPVRKATLVDGKLYTAFARGRQIDVQHRGGEFFTDNGGSFSMRLDGVTHVRERVADPE